MGGGLGPEIWGMCAPQPDAINEPCPSLGALSPSSSNTSFSVVGVCEAAPCLGRSACAWQPDTEFDDPSLFDELPMEHIPSQACGWIRYALCSPVQPCQ